MNTRATESGFERSPSPSVKNAEALNGMRQDDGRKAVPEDSAPDEQAN
jgi:hypothetical protein